MIRRYNENVEFFECIICEHTFKNNFVKCPDCGHKSSDIIDQEITFEFKAPNDKDLAMCGVEAIHIDEDFIFTELKIDETPKALLNRTIFLEQRMFNHYDDRLYVFKRWKRFLFIRREKKITVGQQLNLKLDNFDHLRKGGFDSYIITKMILVCGTLLY